MSQMSRRLVRSGLLPSSPSSVVRNTSTSAMPAAAMAEPAMYHGMRRSAGTRRTIQRKRATIATAAPATRTVDERVRASVPRAMTSHRPVQGREVERAAICTPNTITASSAANASRLALPTMPWMRPPSKSRSRDQ